MAGHVLRNPERFLAWTPEVVAQFVLRSLVPLAYSISPPELQMLDNFPGTERSHRCLSTRYPVIESCTCNDVQA